MSTGFEDNYEELEARAEAAVRADEATIGELEGNEFNICDDCPLIGFPQSELSGSESGTGWSADYPGVTTVTIRLRSREGKWSKNILLGTHPGNTISGGRIDKIYDEAADRTQECDGPRKVPPFLGPFALRKCNALEKSKTSY